MKPCPHCGKPIDCAPNVVMQLTQNIYDAADPDRVLRETVAAIKRVVDGHSAIPGDGTH